MITLDISKRSWSDAARGLARMLSIITACAVSAGCAGDALSRAPASPSQPWRPSPSAASPNEGGDASQAAPLDGFSVPADPRIAELPRGPVVDANATYSLPELIDLAQREHPSTRLAWNRARQAALAVGVSEATFLPMLSANVIGGWQRTSTPSPLTLDGRRSDIDADLHGVAPFLAIEWLLFDFGQRRALAKGAEHASYAANVLFNGAHQKIIHDVTHAYYTHAAAGARLRIAKEALANSRQVRKAVEQRLKGGLATTVELALARQQVAQTVLRVANAEGLERNAYQSLLAAAGLPPTSKIHVGGLEQRTLPRAAPALTDEAIRTALSRRPDLQASYAALGMAETGVAAAEADFMPKVYLAAVAGGNRTSFEAAHLPALRHRSSNSAVLLGVTLPLYDAGLRAARLKDAEIHVDNAKRIFQKAQQDAVREIVMAQDVLHSALASYYAADELTRTASIAYDAALEAYRHGVGTATVAIEAATGLLDARSAHSDAHAASLSAAANLAFVMGAMTAHRDSWLEQPGPETHLER